MKIANHGEEYFNRELVRRAGHDEHIATLSKGLQMIEFGPTAGYR
jgi:hypothetical protein